MSQSNLKLTLVFHSARFDGFPQIDIILCYAMLYHSSKPTWFSCVNHESYYWGKSCLTVELLMEGNQMNEE